ncbi:MAG: family 78 glycoside hydrolase catalytic domain [Bacteroidales bacterium]|nr:family 78 glycoside hydrolase catalytic domain [Bacteroidales bacterium]
MSYFDALLSLKRLSIGRYIEEIMKYYFTVLLLLVLVAGSCTRDQLTIVDLRCEYKENPIGVDVENLRFSWKVSSEQRGAKQSAYRIVVSSSIENLDKELGDVWDSKKIASDRSIQICYAGKPLQSNSKYFWKVTVWNQGDIESTSEAAFWTTGLMKESDWKAKWIGLDRAVGDDNPNDVHTKLTARMLRHDFEVNKKVKSARAFISGLGLFELYINGEKIGDQVLSPGLTEYNKRAFYVTFDVTENLKENTNVIGVILGNGRYFAPRLNDPFVTLTYGFPKVICQLEIEYENGTRARVISDESWKLNVDGPTRKNNEYDGEYYDARMELDGWSTANYDDAKWINAELVEKPGELLVAQSNEPIKIMEELIPVAVNEVEPGVFIFDMGQNMVGWVELFVKGNRGDNVSLRFAELVNDDGKLFLDNIRGAEVTDTYILKGEGQESWEPKFTYHGFRYVEMKGFPGIPDLSSIKGKVIHDALDLSGSFICSNNMINSIYKNAYWGIRGNYRSIPTDCPQRDERQGWLGDRANESIGESFIFDVSGLYNKWLVDIQNAQQESGSLPDVAPSYWPYYSDNTTWPGTYLFVSDMLHNQYGDIRTIETHYPYMQKWIDYMSRFLADELMLRDTYGDWCTPPQTLELLQEKAPLVTTNSEYIAAAYFYYEIKLMEKFALLLNKEDEASGYAKTADKMKIAFNGKFLDKNHITYSNNTVTANLLALAFDLVPVEYKSVIIDNLLRKIIGENKNHIGNGLIGGQWLMRTLTENGHADVAYALAVQNTYPGWGYMVENGATTIWELWNGDKADPGMNSGNHVMLLGDLIIWYYESLAGIKSDPKNPGFKHIIMKPNVVGDLRYVDASYNSIHGKIESSWKLSEDKFNWDITVPANTYATIYVPTLEKDEVFEGGKPSSNSDGVVFLKWENNRAVFQVESGSYSFSSKNVKKTITKTYTSIPKITPLDTTIVDGGGIDIQIECENKEALIRYTTDGSEPTEDSEVYSKSFSISKSTLLKAKAFKEGEMPSSVINVHYDFIDPDRNGINWKLFKGDFIVLPDLTKMKPYSKGEAYHFDLNETDYPKHYFVLKFDSYIQIDKSGEYSFYTSSNDGSKLYIDNKLVVDNDGLHAVKQVSGKTHLNKGKHLISVEYFQSGGSSTLSVHYKSDEISYQPIPGNILFKDKY